MKRDHVLYCRGCSREAGTVEVVDGDADLLKVNMSNDRKPLPASGLRMHVIHARTVRLSDSELWPLSWPCDDCGQTVSLDRDEMGSAERRARQARETLETLGSREVDGADVSDQIARAKRELRKATHLRV